jgi:hypothetical protein
VEVVGQAFAKGRKNSGKRLVQTSGVETDGNGHGFLLEPQGKGRRLDTGKQQGDHAISVALSLPLDFLGLVDLAPHPG